MVERLKQAIEKARRERESRGETAPVSRPAEAVAPAGAVETAWRSLPDPSLSSEALTRARVITHDKRDSAHAAFDVTRTRILKACREKNWRRIAVTSPTKRCGKTFVGMNLAFSVARNPNVRCVLVDFDLKRPALHAALKLSPPARLPAFLSGEARLEDVALRLLPNLAVVCGEPVPDSAELIQNPRTRAALGEIESKLAPDVILFDMPPVFAADDVLSLIAEMDAYLMVAAAGQTTTRDVTDAEHVLGDAVPFLGIVLNMVDPAEAESYQYEY